MAKRDAEHLSPVQLARSLGARVGGTPFRELVPMLASQRAVSLTEAGWIYELKLDGARILAERTTGGVVTLRYRSKRDATVQYPEIVRALAGICSDGSFVLDGEVIAMDDQGRPSFPRLQRRFGLTDGRDIARATKDVPVAYVVFDVLSVGGLDTTPLPLSQRRELLAKVLVGAEGIVTRFEGVEGDGTTLYALCEARDLEGLVAKRLDSPYRAGARDDAWVKIKRVKEEDFVVVGMTRAEGERTGFGALELATYASDGRLVYRGRVGSGFDQVTLTRLAARLKELAVDVPGVAMDADGKVVVYVTPHVVVRVRFSAWSAEGRLRHPVFVCERDDVSASDCGATVDP